MPSGLYRGIVARVSVDGLMVNIPQLGDALWGPVEAPPGEVFTAGDRVLCGFFQDLHSQLEVIRRAVTPTVVESGTYTSTYGGSY